MMKLDTIIGRLGFVMICCAVMTAGCSGQPGSQPATENRLTTTEVKMNLTSTAFRTGGMMPSKFTCDGENVSPPLEWSDPPARTAAFVIICDDPDAPGGTWLHWTIYDIPAGTRSLAEGLPDQGVLEDSSKQGRNDFKDIGYNGPCPPPGRAHRYSFRLHALNAPTGLPPNASLTQLRQALEGKILATSDLIGKYGR